MPQRSPPCVRDLNLKRPPTSKGPNVALAVHGPTAGSPHQLPRCSFVLRFWGCAVGPCMPTVESGAWGRRSPNDRAPRTVCQRTPASIRVGPSFVFAGGRGAGVDAMQEAQLPTRRARFSTTARPLQKTPPANPSPTEREDDRGNTEHQSSGQGFVPWLSHAGKNWAQPAAWELGLAANRFDRPVAWLAQHGRVSRSRLGESSAVLRPVATRPSTDAAPSCSSIRSRSTAGRPALLGCFFRAPSNLQARPWVRSPGQPRLFLTGASCLLAGDFPGAAERAEFVCTWLRGGAALARGALGWSALACARGLDCFGAALARLWAGRDWFAPGRRGSGRDDVGLE